MLSVHKLLATAALLAGTLPSTAASPGAGGALRFDGVDDYVELGLGDTSNSAAERNFTLEAWVRSAGGSGFVVSTNYQPYCSDKGYSLSTLEEPGGHGRLWAHLAQDACGNDSVLDTAERPLGSWHHAAMVFEVTDTDGATSIGTLRLFLDGELQGEQTDLPLDSEQRPWLKFGTHSGPGHAPGVAGTYFHGDLDEVRIWNRARSGEEIRCTMAVTLTGFEADLAGYWTFDEDTGQTVANHGNPDTWTTDPFGWEGLLGGSPAAEDADPAWIFSDAPVGPPPVVLSYCAGDGSTAPCPCGNEAGSPAEGCRNSTGAGARIELAGGTNSVAADDLQFRATQLPLNQSALLFHGTQAPLAPFGDGLRCAGGTTFRFPIRNADAAGSILEPGPQVSGIASAVGAQPGEVGHFQVWYRDPSGPCGQTFNLSSALKVYWQP